MDATRHRSFVFWNNIGVMVEYYDYVVFFLLLPYISCTFLPEQGQSNNIIKAYLIASSGPWSRLLCSFVFSWLLRFYDVGMLLIYGITLMSFSTLCIGLLPGFNLAGVVPALLLIFLRVIQGVAFAMEMPNSLLFGSLHLPKFFGIFASNAISGTAFGGALAHFVMMSLEFCFSKQQMLNWGWRMPFFLGGALGFVGIFMRQRYAVKSKLSSNTGHTAKEHLISVFKLNLFVLAKIALIWAVPLSMVACYVALPYLFASIYGFDNGNSYLATMFGLIVSGLYSLLFGKFTQIFCIFGRVVHYLFFCLILGGIAFLQLGKSLISIYVFCALYQMVVVSLLNIGANCSLQLLRPESRDFVIAYNFSNALASLVPLFVLSDTMNFYSVVCLIFLSAIYMIFLDRRALRPLDRQ